MSDIAELFDRDPLNLTKQDLMKIIEVLDVDSFASIQVELYPVRYAGVEDLARERAVGGHRGRVRAGHAERV